MSTIMKASHQWANRPADERYTSLTDMAAHFEKVRADSAAHVVPSRRLDCIAEEDQKGLFLVVNDRPFAPTNWAFGQVSQLAEAPAGYLRSLPSALAADCINYGLQIKRDVEDVGVLTYVNGAPMLRAATGPNYGRIWNVDILRKLVENFGDGVSGPTFRVPGEFGKAVEVTKENTTLYASDRDMFVFLADEEHRIEVPGRRDGETGSLARGFFIWNSEVGDKTFGLASFLFDYVCCNRIVWGAMEYKELTIRHTASAPLKFLDEVTPALLTYAKSSTATIEKAIEESRKAKIEDDVKKFFANRQFGKRTIEAIIKTHELEEGRPIETLWDATTAVTAYARGIPNQDKRVEVERMAGDIFELATK